MGINIKNPDVEVAVRQLADERGIDLTEAIRLAVRHELERSARGRQRRVRRMRALADRVAALPLGDNRTDEEILGYDEAGVPS
ncbi:MAG: type II toxin-antitoxin system VapB family antitoxin [Vulcanimicrobiaceae bacterium]